MVFGQPDFNLNTWGIRYLTKEEIKKAKKKTKEEDDDEIEYEENEDESDKEIEYEDPEKTDEEDKEKFEKKRSYSKEERDAIAQRRANAEVRELERDNQQFGEKGEEGKTTHESKFGASPAENGIGYQPTKVLTDKEVKELEAKKRLEYLKQREQAKNQSVKDLRNNKKDKEEVKVVGDNATETPIKNYNDLKGNKNLREQMQTTAIMGKPERRLGGITGVVARLAQSGHGDITRPRSTDGGKLGSTIGATKKSATLIKNIKKTFNLLEVLKDQKDDAMKWLEQQGMGGKVPQGLSARELQTAYGAKQNSNFKPTVAGTGKGRSASGLIGGKVKPIKEMTDEEKNKFKPATNITETTVAPNEVSGTEGETDNSKQETATRQKKKRPSKTYWQPNQIREAMTSLGIEGDPSDYVTTRGEFLKGHVGEKIYNWLKENNKDSGTTKLQAVKDLEIDDSKTLPRFKDRDPEVIEAKKKKEAERKSKKEAEAKAKNTKKQISEMKALIKEGKIKDMPYSKFREMHVNAKETWIKDYIKKHPDMFKEDKNKSNLLISKSLLRLVKLNNYVLKTQGALPYNQRKPKQSHGEESVETKYDGVNNLKEVVNRNRKLHSSKQPYGNVKPHNFDFMEDEVYDTYSNPSMIGEESDNDFRDTPNTGNAPYRRKLKALLNDILYKKG